jgi:hypothetical protein
LWKRKVGLRVLGEGVGAEMKECYVGGGGGGLFEEYYRRFDPIFR